MNDIAFAMLDVCAPHFEANISRPWEAQAPAKRTFKFAPSKLGRFWETPRCLTGYRKATAIIFLNLQST